MGRRPARWNDEALEAELREFLDGRPDWPTSTEFEGAGRHDLRQALKNHGGVVYWADRLGVSLRPGQDRAKYTEQDALDEACELVVELGHVPGESTARRLGYGRFATYVRKHGGAAAFARRHGFPETPKSRHDRRYSAP